MRSNFDPSTTIYIIFFIFYLRFEKKKKKGFARAGWSKIKWRKTNDIFKRWMMDGDGEQEPKGEINFPKKLTKHRKQGLKGTSPLSENKNHRIIMSMSPIRIAIAHTDTCIHTYISLVWITTTVTILPHTCANSTQTVFLRIPRPRTCHIQFLPLNCQFDEVSLFFIFLIICTVLHILYGCLLIAKWETIILEHKFSY